MKAFFKKLSFKRYDPVVESLYAAAVSEGERELYYVDWALLDARL